MNPASGTVTDPLWYDVLTILFLAIAFATVLVATGSLIVRYLEYRAEQQAEHSRPAPRPLPRTTIAFWYPDPETPLGDQLLHEYVGGRP